MWGGIKTEKGRKKQPERDWLRCPLSEREMKMQTHGYLAIYERRRGRARLYLRQRGALRDEWGRVFPDAVLDWAGYGRVWQAYAIDWTDRG